MEKFISANGCALRIRDNISPKTDLSQKTIVLLHGYLESLDVWDDFFHLLNPHRVLAPDLPGHGISEIKGEIHTMDFLADTVKDILDECGIDKCVLAGHSMGGYVALEFLRKYPQYLEGVILMHSTADPDSEDKKSHRLREIAVIDADKKDTLASSVEKGFAAENRIRFSEIIEDLKEQVILTEEDGIKALLRGMMERNDLNSTLQASNIAELFIFGIKDEYITIETAQSFVERNPQAKVVWLENSGHMGFIEEAEQTAAAIKEFCTTL